MGRWDSEEDDWHGWKDGKYDNRYQGFGHRADYNKKRIKRKKNQKRSIVLLIIVAIGFAGFVFVNVNPEANQKVGEVVQNLPENLESAGKTTGDLASKTSMVLGDAIKEQLSEEQIRSLDSTIDQISQIPKDIEEKSIEIQKGIEEDQIQREKEQKLETSKYLENISQRVHILVNEERTQRGLSPLAWNEKIAKAAQNHSNDMATRGYFEHDSPEGYDFTWRYSQVGFDCLISTRGQYYLGGENIMYMDGYSGVNTVAKATVDGWMNSPGHRDNMLTSYYKSEGIGVAQSGSEIYVTQDFC